MTRRSRRAVLGTVATGVSLGLAGCAGDGDGDADWSDGPVARMAQYDARHSGYHPDTTAPRGDLEVAWQHRPGDTEARAATQPVVAGGTLYYCLAPPGGVSQGTLFAVDAATGDERWRFDAEQAARATLALHDGRVVAPVDGELRGLSADDGSSEWSVSLESFGWTPTVAAGTAYLVTDDGALYAVDATDGTTEWTIPEPEETYDDEAGTSHAGRGRFVAATDDRVVHEYTGRPGEVVVRSASDGSVEWRAESSMHGPPVVDGGTLYGLNVAAGIYAHDLASGEERHVEFRPDVSGAMAGQPLGVSIADGTAYSASRDGTLTAVDLDTGRRWTASVAEKMETSAPVVADDVVYFSANGHYVEAFEQESALVGVTDGGDVVVEHTASGQFSAPAVLDGTVYVGVRDDAQAGVRMTAFEEA